MKENFFMAIEMEKVLSFLLQYTQIFPLMKDSTAFPKFLSLLMPDIVACSVLKIVFMNHNDLIPVAGILSFPDGSRMEGDFKNDSFEGFGSYIFSDDSYLRGNWIEGEMNGEGEEYDGHGDCVYKGSYKNSLRHGRGILYYPEVPTVFLCFLVFTNRK
jgi:hypothetical protein